MILRTSTRNTVSFYFDQSLVGTTDLNTLDGRSFANYANAYAGFDRNNVERFDNFQIGTKLPAGTVVSIK